MNNITFDIETIGTGMRSPIVQIGAVKFDIDGNILDEFIANIDLASLDRYNFDINLNTAKFWFSQPEETIKSVLVEGPRIRIKQALQDLVVWVGDRDASVYWSHANFDAPILEYACEVTGVSLPFKRQNQRDIRTLVDLVKVKENIKRTGIHHNALDDAKHQAKYIALRLKENSERSRRSETSAWAFELLNILNLKKEVEKDD